MGELELPPGDARLRREFGKGAAVNGVFVTEEAQSLPRVFRTIGEFEEVPGIFYLTRKPSQSGPEN